jgi:site-specific DNA-cytosine methylase
VRTLHLFAGRGGSLYTAALLGHVNVAAVELDDRCCDGLLAEWPGLMVWRGDARWCEYARLAGSVDCVMAGWPCQNVSRMGDRSGLAGERSGLWSEVGRALRETRPAWALLENGPDLPVLGLDQVAGDLADLGMDLRWGVLGAGVAGAPQGRARWYGLARAVRDGLEGQREAWPAPEAVERGRPARRVSVPHVADGPLELVDRFRRLAGADLERCAVQPPAWLHAAGAQRDDADGRGLWPPRRGDTEAWRAFTRAGGPEPGLRRPVDGLALATVRHDLEALGNGWVPQQAAAAWYLLGGP